jgi:DNA-binding PadR family transcriptional regulator
MAKGSMIEALSRAKRWGMGTPPTYMPHRGEYSLFRKMEAKGLVVWREADLTKVAYAGYEITDEGKKALDEAPKPT